MAHLHRPRDPGPCSDSRRLVPQDSLAIIHERRYDTPIRREYGETSNVPALRSEHHWCRRRSARRSRRRTWRREPRHACPARDDRQQRDRRLNGTVASEKAPLDRGFFCAWDRKLRRRYQRAARDPHGRRRPFLHAAPHSGVIAGTGFRDAHAGAPSNYPVFKGLATL